MMQGEQKKPDIKMIMDEIKQKAAERNYEGIPGFEDFDGGMEADTSFDFNELRDHIGQLFLCNEIEAEGLYPEGGLKGVLKKEIRKVNRFWVVPLAAQQTVYNTEAANCFHQVENFIREQQEIIVELQKRTCALEKEIRVLKEKQNT